jgi:transposase-like protein
VQGIADMDGARRPFVPPHCPRTDCRFHTCRVGWRWVRHGSFPRRCAPQRIQRYRCCHCRTTFSTQTFSCTYYLKRPELLEPTFHRLLAGSGLRQITREARCAHSTVMGLAARLARHALLYLAAHRPLGPVPEPLVIDGFESFAYSQYQPLHLNLVVGAESHFVYGFTLSTLRRKGRMTERQRARRAHLEATQGRPEPRALERDMAAALRLAVPEPQPLIVRSDEHPAYPRAFRQLAGYAIRHERTPSIQARTPGNPLFPVNLMDLLLRHNSANHKRETIAFSKRHQAVIERAALLVLWRNYVKRFSENHAGQTPAMRLGLSRGPRSPRALLQGRQFASRVALPPVWGPYYRRRVPTVGITHAREHRLTRAF